MLNIGMLFRWGSVLMNMVQDPNIHLLARGAWTGIRKLRGAMEPGIPSHPLGAAPNTSGTQGFSYGLGNPFSPNRLSDRDALKGSGAVPSLKGPFKTGPSETEIKQLLRDPRVQEFLSENPQMRRMIEEASKRPHKGQRGGKLMPKLFGKPRQEESPAKGFNEPFPFPWMQQRPTVPANQSRYPNSQIRKRRP
ncbi:hypothetical protein SAMN04489725_10726 [Alicyclobacillus hesperidum]|uniref:Uncharacterized protein n=1 Tax=Alicyclobacillus hesperidum TaxID=89784 RepID=A0A1H2U3D0_9BACL|nr:hypothetical protein SAMN04489725_10726 [Alicyclobacillus hesperidum]